MNVPDRQEFPLSPNNQTPVGLRVTPPTDSEADGAGEMLHRIEAYLRSYLSFPDNRYYLPLALFAVLQHCWDECFDEVPYLSVAASVKGAGKTRILELLQFLAGDERAVLLDGSVTLPALYMETDGKKVVLIDESERLQNPNSQFRPILNGGYRSGQSLKRKIGGEVKSFSIFCPKVFAQIGDVHDSLRDRCIVIEMQRTKSTSRTEYVRQFTKEEGTELSYAIQEAVGARIGEIRDAYLNYQNLYPSLGFLGDRDRELWKPLFALSQVFASDRIHDLERSAADIAALKTVPPRRFEHLKDEEEKARKLEYAERLLRDVQTVVGERDRIATADLLNGLRDIATSPWRTYEGIGITEISMAALLKLFGVEPKTIRVKPKSEPNSTVKGYLRTDMVAGATMAQVQPNAEPERNPVTHVGSDVSMLTVLTPIGLTAIVQSSECTAMHEVIAASDEYNPITTSDVICNINVTASELLRGIHSAQLTPEQKTAAKLLEDATQELDGYAPEAKAASIVPEVAAEVVDRTDETRCVCRDRGNLDDDDYVPIPLATLANRLMGIADELGCAWGLEEFACGIEAIAERVEDRIVLNGRMLVLDKRMAKSPHGVSSRYLFKSLRRDRRYHADMRLILKAGGTTYRGQKILGGDDPYIWRFTRKEIMAELKGELKNQLGVCNVSRTTFS